MANGELYISGTTLVFIDAVGSIRAIPGVSFPGKTLQPGEICIDQNTGKLVWCNAAGQELQAVYGYKTFGSTADANGAIWIRYYGGGEDSQLQYAFNGAIWEVNFSSPDGGGGGGGGSTYTHYTYNGGNDTLYIWEYDTSDQSNTLTGTQGNPCGIRAVTLSGSISVNGMTLYTSWGCSNV